MVTYKLPELIIPSKNAKDKRPYVQYFIYSTFMGKLVRKRDYKLEGDTLKQKTQYARLVTIPEITENLLSGIIITAPKNSSSSHLAKDTVQSALAFALKIKLVTIGQRAKESYSYYLRTFDSFIEENELENLALVNFNKDHAKSFQMWMVTKGYSNRTNRNNTDTMRILFNVLMSSENPPITKNPFVGMDRLSVGMGKNHAYQKHHQSLILQLSKERYPAMYLVILTMYYTLMRTNELCMLQRKHIDMHHADYIYLPAENNTKREMERHIIVTKQLKQLFIEFGIYDVPPDYYIFSNDGCKPGLQKIPTSRLGERYHNWVMQKIPLFKDNKDYTLYSWKHTGVVEAFKAGIKPYNIMKQTGHRNRQSFEVYLKSLGLEENSDFLNNMPDLF